MRYFTRHLLLLLALLLSCPAVVTAVSPDLPMDRATQQQRLAGLNPGSVTRLMLEQARVDVEVARVRLEAAEVEREAADAASLELERTLKELTEELSQLAAQAGSAEQATPGVRRDELDRLIAQRREQQAVARARQPEVEREVAVARETLALAKEWHTALQDLYRVASEQTQQVALEDLELKLRKEEQGWLDKAAALRSELERAQDGGAERLPLRLREAEERARLTRDRLRLAHVEAAFDALAGRALDGSAPAAELSAAADRAQAMTDEVRGLAELLRRRTELTAQQAALAERRSDGREQVRLMQTLESDLNQQANAADALWQRVRGEPARLRALHAESVRRSLTDRRPLPADAAGWSRIGGELAVLPEQLGRSLAEEARGLGRGLAALDSDGWVTLGAALLAWLTAGLALLRWSRRTRSSALAGVLGRSGWLLLPGGVLLLIRFLAPAPEAGFLLALLAAGVPTALVLGALARHWLVRPELPEERRRPRLYRQLVLLGGVGAVLLLVMTWAHLALTSQPLLDLVDRAFMLVMLAATLPALEVRRLAIDRLHERVGGRFWPRAIRLLTVPLPLATLAAAAVGIIGYVNLAWAVVEWLAIAALALGLWMGADALLREGVQWLKRRPGMQLRYGDFWSQAVLDPGYRVARVALFASVVGAVLNLAGVGWESPPVALVLRLLQAPLMELSGNTLTPMGILVAAGVLAGAVWIGRWLRLVGYSLLFARVADRGMRHSLSVLTQYAFVVVGMLVTLRVAGIDLTTLTIFAGALGVGLGFGLQNLAHNFISGILLLVERPLRARDIVRIGEHEGEVTHIGMRALTVRTWDNEEVILPNSEVTSHPFTNWTRSDNVVRTVVKVRVGFDADLHRAKATIEAILRAHPAVLEEPGPDVWLERFGEFAVEMHVQYFVDLDRVSRLQVRSEILFSIWERLNEAGIRIAMQHMGLRLEDDGAMVLPNLVGVRRPAA